MAILNFNAAQVPPAEAMEVIPAGWYPGQMVASEMKPTAKGDGQYLACEYEVMGGEYAGRKLFDNLNLVNQNQKAVEIAYRALSAICHAVNVIQVADSQQLHGKPIMIKVKVSPAGVGADGKNYDARNDVAGYKAYEGGASLGNAQAAPAWATQQAQVAPAAFVPQIQQPAQGFGQVQQTTAPTPPWMQQSPATQPQAPAQTMTAGNATPPWMQQNQQQSAQVNGALVPPWAKK